MAIVLKTQNITNMYTPIELVTTGIGGVIAGGGHGVTDHGLLYGLWDNDHPQYLQTSVSSAFLQSVSMSDYQLTANNSLSLGTDAAASFVYTSNSSVFMPAGNSTLLQLTANNSLSLAVSATTAFIPASNSTLFAASDHSHGAVSTVSTSGSNVELSSASTGLTLAMPNYITTAYGAAIQGSGTYTQNTGTIQFANSNGISFGLDTDGVMTATMEYASQVGILGISDDNGSVLTNNTINFANSNGLSFGLSGSTMTASYTVPGNTVFSNSNNVEFGLSGSTITALALLNQTDQTANVHNVSLSGNTSGTLTEISSGTMTLAGGNNITLSQDGNQVTIIGAAQGGVQTGISGIGASNTTYTSGSVIWSGQNNITIGTYVTSDSQYVRLSVGNYLTTAAQSDHTHGSNVSTASTTGTDIKFTSSSNGLTAGIPKYLTTAMQSQSSSVFAKTGFTTQSTSGTDVVGTLNTAGLNLGVPKYQSTGAYLTTAMASNAGSSFVYTSNSSLFQHTSATSAITSAAQPSANMSNFAGIQSTGITGGSATVNSSQILLDIPQNSLYFSDANGVSWGASTDGISSTITANISNGSLYFSDANGVSWGASTDGVSSTITASVSVVGGGGGGTSIVPGNYLSSSLNGSTLSLSVTGLQATSATSAITASAMNTSERAGLQYTSANTKFAGVLTTGVTGAEATFNSSQLQLNVSRGSVYYNDSNGVTFGVSTSGSSSTITASVNTAGAGAGTNSAITGGSMTVNTSGISINLPSYLTTAALSNHTHTVVGGTVSGTANMDMVFGADKILEIYAGDWDNSSVSSLYGYAGLLVASSRAGIYNEWISTSGADSTKASHDIVLNNNELYFLAAYSNSDVNYSIGFGFDVSQGLYYANQLSSISSQYSTNNYWIPSKKYVDDQTAATNLIVVNSSGDSVTITSSPFVLSAGNWMDLHTSGSSVVRIDALPQVVIQGGSTGTYFSQGDMQFANSNGVSFGLSTSSGGHATMTAAVADAGNLYFSDIAGFSFGSSVSGVSTSIYLITA